MAFHTYMSEGVDSAIIECGIGGEYDTTNVLASPTVTGITSLGIDHVAMLGNSIEEIAWHKSGIMKPGTPGFTAPQPPPALEVLRQRAISKSVSLEVVEPDHSLSSIPLGLAADFQVLNASLAVRIAATHLSALGHPPIPQTPLPREFLHGLQHVRWPGRCDTRREQNIAWHIDSGHTLESIQAAATWFASVVPRAAPDDPLRPIRILLFNQQTRDAPALAKALHSTLVAALAHNQPFTHAVFCTNITFQATGFRPDLVSINTNPESLQDLRVQKLLAETWRDIDPTAHGEVIRTIEEAVDCVRGVAAGVDGQAAVLVTGSSHLVGGFLEVLETGKGKDEIGG